MDDYEVRDIMRRGLEYAAALGFAWEALFEARRLGAASKERLEILNSVQRMPRTQLLISVSSQLRASGKALTLLSKPMRLAILELVTSVDAYNSVVETRSPANDSVDITQEIRAKLDTVTQRSFQASTAFLN
jgi:hypothetical protein